jgi:hypothetical protein
MTTLLEDKDEVSIPAPLQTAFTPAITAAALGIRKALADLVSAVPGNVRRPREFEHALGLDYKLSWCVFHVIGATNVLGAANHIPKPGSIRRILDRAERKGVPVSILTALRGASDEFERVVRIHARDRSTFDAMVAGVSPTDGEGQIDLVERRTAFRVNAHIWGNQTETQAVGFFVRHSSDGQSVDECAVTSRLGLQRIRPGARTIAYRYEVRPGEIPTEIPLDPEAHRLSGACLLPEFCTKPLPHFKKEISNNLVAYEFEDEAVGLSSAVDLSFGSIMRNFKPLRTPDGRHLTYYSMTFRTPVARLHLDLLVHRPSFGKVSPELLVIGSMNSQEVPTNFNKSELMPVRAEIVSVAGGIAGAQTADAPRYADMLGYACKSLDWNPAEFDIYRVVMEYPVLHSTVRFQFHF